MYYTMKDAADTLGRTERQTKYLIKNGVLNPVNKDTYRRDGGYRFSREHVWEVKQKLSPSGLKLKEAAALVGITPQYLSKLSLEGVVNSRLVKIGKRTERRFNKEDLMELKKTLEENPSKNLQKFGKKIHVFKGNSRLFEKVSYNGQPARIISTAPLTLLIHNGSKITVEQNFNCNEWPEKSYVTKKGFVILEIPIPHNPEHPAYDAIYKLIEGLGEKNIQIFERETGDYFVRLRQGKLNLSKEEFYFLKRYVIDGKIDMVEDGVVQFSTGTVSQYVHIPEETYIKLEKYASERDSNIQDCIIELLNKSL